MSQTTITFIARITAKPGAEGQLGEAITNLVATTRKEAGCLQYFPTASLERPGEFVIYESWTSEAAFEAHTKSPHFGELVARMPELCAGPPSREMLRPLA